jgi:hypothetical protein
VAERDVSRILARTARVLVSGPGAKDTGKWLCESPAVTKRCGVSQKFGMVALSSCVGSLRRESCKVEAAGF